jgi:hypothetical protein
MEALPAQSFAGINDAAGLENLLNAISQTVYVTVDTDAPTNAAIAASAALEQAIAEQVASIQCPLPPPTIASPQPLDFCEPEFAAPITVPDADIANLLATVQAAQAANYGTIEGTSTGPDATQAILSCVSSMTDITNQINALNLVGLNINQTLINLEELLYNYRIMESFFVQRVSTLSQLTGEFDPLITQEEYYQAQVDLLTPEVATAATTYNTAAATYQTQTGTTEPLITVPANQNTTTSNVTSTNTTNTATTSSASSSTAQVPQVTQQQVALLLSTYNSLNAQLTAAQTQLTAVKAALQSKEQALSPLLQEIDLENTANFQGLTQSQQDQARLSWLQSGLQTLFNNSSTVFDNIANFSTRTVVQFQSSTNPYDQSFIVNIQFALVDPQNVLAGKPKTYATTTDNVTVAAPPNGTTPHGVLYDQLYNIWGNPDLFFTDQERGLTANAGFASAQLPGGSAAFGSNYIQDPSVFTTFYSNFPANHAAKVTSVKANAVEPSLATTVQGLQNLAIQEVEYLFAYGKGFQNLPSQSQTLVGIINAVNQASQQYTAVIQELRADYVFVQQAYKNVQDEIEALKQKLVQVPCATNTPNPPEAAPATPGSDPLGATTIQAINPQDPDPTKWCYWLKFAAYATAVNVLPIPGSGGFKYWPIGMQIPNPSGITNIPLPIAWIPIGVVVLVSGIFVIFIALCGICPGPVVFYIGPNGEKKFIISIRPGDQFGANASTSILKTVTNGGIAVPQKVTDMLNKVKVPGFNPINNPDAPSNILSDMSATILKNINKLNNPDMSALNGITNNSTLNEKTEAMQQVVSTYLQGLQLPTIKIPKDASTVNPKPLPMIEAINQLVKFSKLSLPNIAIPSGSTISLKTKLLTAITGLQPSDLKPVNIPPINFNTATPTQQSAWLTSVKAAMKDGISAGQLKITPKALGNLTTIVGSGMVFINPYKCRPGSTGLGVPPLPPASVAAIGAIKIGADAFIDGLAVSDLKQLVSTTGGAITSAFLPTMLTQLLAAIPDITIPDPSTTSIGSMLSDGAKKLVKMQLPSLPDPSHGLQIQIPIPGAGLKSALASAVSQTIGSTASIGKIDFSSVSSVDMKQIIINLVENSFAPIQNFLNPILNIISNYQASTDKTFPELLGMSSGASSTPSSISTVPQAALNVALAELKALSITPYPAVAFAPEPFLQLHPLLTSDDLPPWVRFTLDNFLFVTFLDQFCSQGKKTCGFQENP